MIIGVLPQNILLLDYTKNLHSRRMVKGRLMMFYRLLILVFFYSFVCTPADSRVIQKRAAFYIANETMCIVDGDVYRNGDPVPTDDECERCTCRPPGFSCVLRDCDTKPGCKAVRKVGECCPEYVCGCVHNNRLYEDGELIKDLQNNCYTCRCHGSSISCIFADCHFRGDCQPEYVQGECCPRYDHCPTKSTTTTTTTRVTPSSGEIQQEIDFVNFTTQHLQNFAGIYTTATVQDVFSSDSEVTTPAYEISKETLLSVKFTLSSEKLSSIHDFDVAELTTLLPLQSVTYKEVTRHVVPPLHTELTTLKDGVIVGESDKTTIEQQGETEVAIEVTTSKSELDSSKKGVSDTHFANVGGTVTTKYEADDIKLSVTKDGIFVPVGFEISTETTTDSQVKITEVIESEISTFHEEDSSTFASGSKISTIKQDDHTESLQPVFVTTVTPERQDTTTDHGTHLKISELTVAESHTDSDVVTTQDTQATSTEYFLSTTTDRTSSGSIIYTGENLSEDFTVSSLDDLDSQSTNLQTSDSVHGDFQTSDSLHDDLQSSDSIHDDLSTSDSAHGDSQTSESEKSVYHSSTQEHLAFLTTTLGSTELHSDNLHTDDEEELGITDNSASSVKESTTEEKTDILHSTSDDSHEFDSERVTKISTTSDKTDITTHESLSSISENNDLATAADDKIETITSTATAELQTTDDNTVTSGLTGQDTESSIHQEYKDSVISKSTYNDIRTTTEISDSTHISKSHESFDINSFTVPHVDDENLKSTETTGVSDYDKKITSTDHNLSITTVTPEVDFEELDSSEHGISTVLHETELKRTSTPSLETNENYSTHDESVIASEQQESINESGSQEIITETVSVTVDTLEAGESSFHHTASSHLAKVPSNDNMDISDLTVISPSTIYPKLDFTADVAHSTSFQHETTDLESDTERTYIASESASTTAGDLSPPLIYTDEKLQKINASDLEITSIESTESDNNLGSSKEEIKTEFVPYLSTENDISNANQTDYESFTIAKDGEQTNIETHGTTTLEQASESDIIVTENSKISTYSKPESDDGDAKDLNDTKLHDEIIKETVNSVVSLVTTSYTEHGTDMSEVFSSETDNEEGLRTAGDSSTAQSEISTDLISTTHDILESEVTTKEKLDTLSTSSEESQTSETSSDFVEITETGDLGSKQDEITSIQEGIYSSKQPYTVTDTASAVEDDSRDTEHFSTHKEVTTQSQAPIQIITSKPTVEIASPTPENGLPSEIPGFEPPLANIFKQPMLFNRPTTNKEHSPTLLPLESSQNKSSNYSDENDVLRLSLTLAEDESEENGTQPISLIGNVPESDENNVFVLNHEYTISDSEVNDIDFFDAEEIDLTSEEITDDTHAEEHEEPVLSSTLHDLSAIENVPNLDTSTAEVSTKIDIANPIYIYNDNDDIKTIHSSEEKTDSSETKVEIANNTNTLQLNSLPAVSAGEVKTDSSLSSIHNIDKKLINTFEGVKPTGDSQTSESISNDEVLSTVRVEYFSTKSEGLPSVENTETTTSNFYTAELVSDENSDLIPFESIENNESENTELTQHRSTLNGENQEDLEDTTKESSIISTTAESSVHDTGETSDNDNVNNEDDENKHNEASAESINEELTSEFADLSTEGSESDNSHDIYVQTGSPFSHQDAEAVDSTEQETEVHASTAEFNSGLHPDLLTALYDISSTLDTNLKTSENFNETVNTHEENYSEPSTTEDASTIKINILFGQNFFDSSRIHDISTTIVSVEEEIATEKPVKFHIDSEASLTNSDSELENESSTSFHVVKSDPSEHDKNIDLKESNDEKITSHSLTTDDKSVEYQDGEVYDDSLTSLDSDLNSQQNMHGLTSESANEITDSKLFKDGTTDNGLITSESRTSLENTSSSDLISNAEESSSPFTILEYIGDLFSTFSTLSDVIAESTLNQDIISTKGEDLITSEIDSQTSESSINNSSDTSSYNSHLKDEFSQYGYLGGVFITGQSKYNSSLKELTQNQNNDTLGEHLTTDNEVDTQSSEPIPVTSSKSSDETTSSVPENDFPSDTLNFEPPLAHIFKHPMFTKEKITNKESNPNLHQIDSSLSSNEDSFHGNGTSTISSLENFGTNNYNSDSETEVDSEKHQSEAEVEIIKSTSTDDISFSATTDDEQKSASENVESFDSETILNTENLDEYHESTSKNFVSTISSETHDTDADTHVTTTNADASKDISDVDTVLPTSTLAPLEETSGNEVVELSSNINDNNNSELTETEENKEEGPEKEGEYFEPTEPHFPLANSVSDEEDFDSTSNSNAETHTMVFTEKHSESEKTGDVLETFTETFSINDVNSEIKSTTSNYVDSNTIVGSTDDKSSTSGINNDESFSSTALPNTEPSILDVTEINSDSILLSNNVPPLPILLKHMNQDNIRIRISENIPHEIGETSLNDSKNASTSLTETDQDGDDETSTNFGQGRNLVHPLHLTDVISQVFKAPGYDAEFRSNLFKGFPLLRKTRESRLKRNAEDIQPVGSDRDFNDSSMNNSPTSVAVTEDYSINNKNILLVEGFGQKPSGFFPVTSSLIIVQSDEETEENEYKKNAKRKEAKVDTESDISEFEFLDVIPFGSPQRGKPSDLKKTYPVK